MTIQLVKASELRTVADGPGFPGRVGVIYQDVETGQTYAWNPATRVMAVVAGEAPGGAVTSVAGRGGAVTLTRADVGLSNVDNTSDANKPVSTLQAAAIAAAALAGPAGTGGSTPVVDNLISTSATSALSANQGRVLQNTKLDASAAIVITDTKAVPVAADGMILLDSAAGNAAKEGTYGGARTFFNTVTLGTALPTTGTINLDLAALDNTPQAITLTGNASFTTSNRVAGRRMELRVEAGAATRALTWPAWQVFGSPLPTSLASGTTLTLALRCVGGAAGAIDVAWASTGAAAATNSIPLWLASTAYTAGQQVVHPETGLIVKARANHTSASTFDGRQWAFPSSKGDTVFDFTAMSDRPAAEVYPIQGRMNYGTSSAANTYGVFNRRFTGNTASPPSSTIYFEGELADPSLRVQHLWLIVDVDQNPSDNNQITFILNNPANPSPGTVGAIESGVHWDFFARIGASYAGQFNSGPYPGSGLLAGIPAGPTFVPRFQLRGKTFRYDLVMDRTTGMVKAFVDGRLVIQYGNAQIPTYCKNRGAFQINSQSQFYVQKFGISADIPEWATNGSARGTVGEYNVSTGVSTLSSTWQALYTFNVGYDSSGVVEVTCSPLITSSSGVVQMQIAPASASQGTLNANSFPTTVLSGAATLRPFYQSGWSGTPGTTERLSIWIKTTGAASVDTNTGGQGHCAWSYRSILWGASVGV